MTTLRSLLALATAVLATSCVPLMQPQTGGPTGPSSTGSPGPGAEPGAEPGAPGGQGVAVGEPAPGTTPGGEKPSAPVPTTVEIKSECSKTVPVFYGDKPKFGSGTKSSVSSNSTSSQGRKADGTLMVWIIDEKENGVASAQVTPTTKRVVIDKSCTSIRAE